MSEQKSGISRKVQAFGSFLSSMIMPNIAAFIAWGLITAMFIDVGWFPNEDLATMVDPMMKSSHSLKTRTYNYESTPFWRRKHWQRVHWQSIAR